MCNLEDMEDEYHFILKCQYYTDIHNLRINTYFTTRPSVYKLTQLFSSSNKKILCNLGKYLLKDSERKIIKSLDAQVHPFIFDFTVYVHSLLLYYNHLYL